MPETPDTTAEISAVFDEIEANLLGLVNFFKDDERFESIIELTKIAVSSTFVLNADVVVNGWRCTKTLTPKKRNDPSVGAPEITDLDTALEVIDRTFTIFDEIHDPFVELFPGRMGEKNEDMTAEAVANAFKDSIVGKYFMLRSNLDTVRSAVVVVKSGFDYSAINGVLGLSEAKAPATQASGNPYL